MIDNLFSNTNILEKALSGTWIRNKIISKNISNVDTPNYKRKEVLFEDYLKQELSENNQKLVTTNEKHIKGLGMKSEFIPKIIEDKSTSYRFDGNNVNIDTESAELSKNVIMYDALVRQITDEYEKVKNAIIEGSK
ncbi:MAG: Flagellar basal body rod protein FlgB [Sporanaerobacter sp.]|jgi:flagellar basal-body rod protein FlgB|uniref:flagellar basal body rod protein FlgB n=1 Tax=Sporanaerobacter sp. TaxID=2010183 RepID=UPI003A100F95